MSSTNDRLRELEEFAGNRAGLRRFYKSDPIAPKILDIFASKNSDTHITTVTRLVSILKDANFKIDRAEVKRVFKELETFECGVYIPGKALGAVTEQARFKWKVSRVLTGRIASDERIR